MTSRRRGRSRRHSWSGPRIARLLAIAAVSVALAWLSVAVGLAGASRESRPDLALRFLPFDARAKAKVAERLSTRSQRDRVAGARARILSQEALARDPTVIPAWRTLAILSGIGGQADRASALFHIVGRMARRDLPSQLWLIEERVAHNDIAGALHHYDVALRTSPRAYDLLLPILVSATAEDAIVQPLARILRADPQWRPYFLAKLSENPPAAANAVRLVELLGAGRPMSDGYIMARLIPRFADRGELAAAWRLYRRMGGATGSADALIRNGGFERPNPLPPFDWVLADDTGISAEQRVISGVADSAVLEVRAASGEGGRPARQMLLLPPGGYRLSWRAGAVGDVPPAVLRWTLSCAGEGGSGLLDLAIAPLDGRARSQGARFQVPGSGCRAQWLDLGLQSEFGPSGVGGWIDAVSISRAP